MEKQEFLRELEYALEGRVPPEMAEAILSGYEEQFEAGANSGKMEEELCAEFGSPARLGRRILEEEGRRVAKPAERTQNESDQQHPEFQKKLHRVAEDVAGKMTRANPQMAGRDLAHMGTRLGAWMIDCFLAFIIASVLTIFFMVIMRIFGGGGWGHLERFFNGYYGYGYDGIHIKVFSFLKELMYGSVPAVFSGIYKAAVFVFGGVMTMSTLCVWLTNGYTPGKWLLKIRIVKQSGEKINFLDALFREFLIKGLANNFLKGFLNIGSFVWACISEDRKTVQDLATQTAVVKVVSAR